MIRGLLMSVLGAVAAAAAAADDPAPKPKSGQCAVLNNRVLGPRTAERPFPVLRGDPARGLRPACAVTWSTLSPRNHALEVADCYGDLLQVANDSACGQGTGPLWVSSRWVVTSAELQQARAASAICQKLETGAWAGTRDFPLNCQTEKKELNLDTKPAPQPSPAADAPPVSSPAPPSAPAESGTPATPGSPPGPATQPPPRSPQLRPLP